ncbi:MAG: RidA family protein [Acidobacteriota bacterium]
MKKIIQTQTAPQALGSYSQGVSSTASEWLFLSGQIAISPETGQLVQGGIEEQTERVLQNLQAVLSAAGGDLSQVVKATIYLQNLEEFAKFNAVYSRYFTTSPPARSTVEVSRLPKGALIEIDWIAALG